MQINKVTPAIGAVITGIDLSAKLTNTASAAIYQALIEHLVIIFPAQNLSNKDQLRFAETFGEIDKPHAVYPHVDGLQQVTLLENDGDRPPDTNIWHTNLSFYPAPPFAAVLHAREVPEYGGDTLWASMYAAYDHLPSTMKSELEHLEAIHDPGTFRNQFLGPDKDVSTLNKSLAEVGSALHPIVSVHPGTGKKCLYVNQGFTNQIYGYSTADSVRLLNYLYSHINQPEFQFRHRWTAGDVVIWDNRVTQHYAVADYFPNYRRMHRVTVVNDRRTG